MYYIGTVFVFHIQINWNFSAMAIAFLPAIRRPLLTIYQQHRNFKVLIYVGVLLIQMRCIYVLTCFLLNSFDDSLSHIEHIPSMPMADCGRIYKQ